MSPSFEVHGTGPAVIFLHGVGSAKEGWRNQIETVMATNHQFIAIDAPGFGTTPLPSSKGFKPHIQAVLQVMDELEIQSATLCGHSLGGMTAQELYAAHPHRVDAMILSATSPAFGRADGEFQKEFLRQRFTPFEQGLTMPDFAKKFAPKLLGPGAPASAIDETIAVMKTVSVDAYKLAMHTITTFDQRANLPKIDIPTLLIAGDHDHNAPSAMMEKMASKIKTANFEELYQTGHMAPVENPRDFNHILKNFLLWKNNA